MKFNYNILSKYRSHLMGMAMIMVVFYHSTINVQTSKILTMIKNIGNSGVDIFLFVSGMGMYFSLKKSKSIREFYTKRVLRLVPVYFPIAFLFALYLFVNGQIAFKNFVLDAAALNFWFNQGFQYWYISASIVLYILTPLYMKYFFKYKNKTLFISLIIIIIINIICQTEELRHLRVFTTRIPIYIIGIKYGELCFEKRKFDVKSISVYLILAILGLSIFRYSFAYLQYNNELYCIEKISYTILTVPICIFTSIILDIIIGKFNLKFQILNIIGLHTLEIYTFHERVLNIFSRNKINIYTDYYNLINNIVIIVITFVISIFWSGCIKKISLLIHNNQKSRKSINVIMQKRSNTLINN